MKQITPEIKAKIFALYWSQQAVVTKGNYTHKQWTTYLIDGDVLSSIGLGSLVKYRYAILANPLSSITDEDAIEVAKILIGEEYTNGRVIRDEENTHVTVVKPNTTINVIVNIFHDGGIMSAQWGGFVEVLPAYDYLRSRGYALPAFGYSVEELVDAGVFKLEQ